MDYSPPTTIIKAIGLLLGRNISTDDIEELEKLRYHLLIERSRVARALSEARLKALQPKDASVTDLDRNVQLEASTAFIMQDLQTLEGLESLIVDRIDLTLQLADNIEKA